MHEPWTAGTIPLELVALHAEPGGTSLRGLAGILNRYDELRVGWERAEAEEALAAEAGPEWARMMRETDEVTHA